MKTRIDLRNKRTLVALARRYVDLRFVEFAMATGAGFMLNLAILALGVVALFHSIAVSPTVNPSPAILGLDVLALGTGDSLAFVMNEEVTVRGEIEEAKGASQWLTRWGKYQLTAFMGNIIIALVQVSLLLAFGLTPAFGSIIGAAFSYPITYMVSMRFVWKVRAFRDIPNPLDAPRRLLQLALRIWRR